MSKCLRFFKEDLKINNEKYHAKIEVIDSNYENMMWIEVSLFDNHGWLFSNKVERAKRDDFDLSEPVQCILQEFEREFVSGNKSLESFKYKSIFE